MATGHLRIRAQKKLIKVTFVDGTEICYSSATKTLIETLKKIGTDKFEEIGLEIGHLPLISKVCHEKFKDYMKPVKDGWYVNIQSDSDQKYMQLMSIKKSLNLDYTVEIGTDIEPNKSTKHTTRSAKEGILVRFPDGEFIGGQSPKDAYIQSLRKIGLESIRQKCIEALGKECVTRFNKYPNQVEVEKGEWVTIPNQTKDKKKALEIIAARFRMVLEITNR
jgi:hypothetical protein